MEPKSSLSYTETMKNLKKGKLISRVPAQSGTGPPPRPPRRNGDSDANCNILWHFAYSCNFDPSHLGSTRNLAYLAPSPARVFGMITFKVVHNNLQIVPLFDYSEVVPSEK
jgi:hypothetical protein